MKKVSDLEELLEETRSAREDLETEVNRLKRSEVKLGQRVTRLEQDLDDQGEVFKTQIKSLQVIKFVLFWLLILQ